MIDVKIATHKPVQVEAVQVTQRNRMEVARWCDGEVIHEANGRTLAFIVLTVDGSMRAEKTTYAHKSDWIVREAHGPGIETFTVYTDKVFCERFEVKGGG